MNEVVVGIIGYVLYFFFFLTGISLLAMILIGFLVWLPHIIPCSAEPAGKGCF